MEDKKEAKGTENILKSATKESMVVSATLLIFSSKGKETKSERKHDGVERRHLTLKEKQEKVYPFSNSNIGDMLKQLLEEQLI